MPTMQGMHLTADLRGCSPAPALMTEPDALRKLCLEQVARAGLRAVGELFHRYAPTPSAGGVTGVVLLAESHLAIHTWPELQSVTLDVYVCNLGVDNSLRADGLMSALIDAFAAKRVERHRLERGGLE